MKIFAYILVAIITSCYFFPFEFTFLSGVNTKLMLAAVGLPFLFFNMLQMKGIILSKELTFASLIAVLFSLIGFYSTDYNNTTDYAYATYIISMWVWFSAAYFTCTLISLTHGYISVKLIVNYLAIICVFQCVIALMINFNSTVKFFVDSYFVSGDVKFMDEAERLYGIGALLDVAGGRFSVVLMFIAVLISTDRDIRNNPWTLSFYILSFFLISVIGNMIARTTSLGMLLGIIYILLKSQLISLNIRSSSMRLWKVLLGWALLLLTFTTFLYNSNLDARELMRFAFEGFFNWVETGKWETHSTDVLKDMWIFPDNLKTWIIGDGYFNNPISGGFYMSTDVGYLRFIFYCGLIGLIVFCFYFIYLSFSLASRFPYFRDAFFMLLIIVFAIWAKVSTDMFLVYALFLSISTPYFLEHYYKNDIHVE